MESLDENKNKLDKISSFSFGWNEPHSKPFTSKTVDNTKRIVNEIEKVGLTQPFLAPWAGGEGIQLEWTIYKNLKEYYLELNVLEDKITCLINNGECSNNSVECSFDNIENAINMIKLFFNDITSSNIEVTQKEQEIAEKAHDFFENNLDNVETSEQRETYILSAMLLSKLYKRPCEYKEAPNTTANSKKKRIKKYVNHYTSQNNW